MTTLEEALQKGRGNERPFQCTSHDDAHDSASVNVFKGVWHCFACQASGVVGKKTAPSPELLLAMLEPERAAREYPHTWLELFTAPGYWNQRFPTWVCWLAGLGSDPFTGDGTYPVYTPRGKLAGVCRRQQHDQPKYLYPPRWSAARTLHGLGMFPSKMVVLVEGAADAFALWEVGIPALATYGSGLHLPQREMLLRQGYKRILTGFDMDAAGDMATRRTAEFLADFGDCQQVRWEANDPADLAPADRRLAVESVVGRVYGPEWDGAVQHAQHQYNKVVEAA